MIRMKPEIKSQLEEIKRNYEKETGEKISIGDFIDRKLNVEKIAAPSDGCTIIVTNPNEKKNKKWFFGSFLKNFLKTSGKDVRSNLMLQDVTEEEIEELEKRGVEFVKIEGKK